MPTLPATRDANTAVPLCAASRITCAPPSMRLVLTSRCARWMCRRVAGAGQGAEPAVVWRFDLGGLCGGGERGVEAVADVFEVDVGPAAQPHGGAHEGARVFFVAQMGDLHHAQHAARRGRRLSGAVRTGRSPGICRAIPAPSSSMPWSCSTTRWLARRSDCCACSSLRMSRYRSVPVSTTIKGRCGCACANAADAGGRTPGVQRDQRGALRTVPPGRYRGATIFRQHARPAPRGVPVAVVGSGQRRADDHHRGFGFARHRGTECGLRAHAQRGQGAVVAGVDGRAQSYVALDRGLRKGTR